MYSFFSEKTGRRVRLGLTAGVPLDTVVFMFGGSHLKNIATHDAVYCLFPQATLERREMLVATGGRISELKFFSKYLERGFRRANVGRVMRSDEFQGGRFVGDPLTKCVPFDGKSRVRPACGKRFRDSGDGVFIRSPS